MTSVVRVASLGAGWVTTNRHIPAMRAAGGFDVVAVADRDGARAQEAARAAGVARHAEAASVHELPFLDELDAISCGTAPFAHHATVKAALEADKHVITEKPFAMTVEEGEELVALARERDRILAVVHNFLFASSMAKLRRWLADGRIGQLRAVWAVQLSNPRRRLPEWVEELPLGLFYDESPHVVYVARALAGSELEPLAATVHPGSRGLAATPGQVSVQLRAGEVPVSLQLNFEAPVSEWHVTAMGDRGMGTVDLFRDIAVYAPNDGAHRAWEVLRTSAASSWHHWSGYARSGYGHLRGTLLYGNEEVFRRFRDAVLTGSDPPEVSARDALDVLRLQHWILGAAGAAGA